GNMNLEQFITFAGTTLKLSADTEIRNPNYYPLGTVDLAGNKLTMVDSGGLTIANPLVMTAAGSEIETRNSDLTLSSELDLSAGSITSTGGSINLFGGATLSDTGNLDLSYTTVDAGLEDLTLDAPINLQSVGIISSGGTIAFTPGSDGSSFDSDSSMRLTDTLLELSGTGTDLAIPYLSLSGNSGLLTDGSTLTPAYLEIGMDGELDFTDIATTDTILRLAGDSNITKTYAVGAQAELILKEINIDGHILTLNPDIVDLTAEAIYFTNYNSESADYLTNTAELRAEGVNINMTKRLWVDRGKITMGGGTLTLVQGGGLADIGFGEIDLTNSTLSLSGPFV
ncbi:uncharacterized protein METZ01_LOCUS329175, partial [marine metagenome]